MLDGTEIVKATPRDAGRRRRRPALVAATVLIGTLAPVVAASPRASASPAAGVTQARVVRPGKAADAWPTFQHDGAHTGVSSDTTWGAGNVAQLTTRWHKVVGGGRHNRAEVLASPLVAYNSALGEEVVYAVSDLGVVHAFSAETGATVFETSELGKVIDTPALDGNTLYVGVTGDMLALDASTGAEQCHYSLPVFAPETTPGRIDASPVVGQIGPAGPVVFFGDMGTSEKLNAGHEWAITGYGNKAGGCRLKWMFNSWANKGPSGSKTGSWSPPALVKEASGTWALVFGSSNPDDSVYALNARTGAELWRFQTLVRGGDEDVGAGPTIGLPGVNGFADGTVYIDGKDDMEYAINLATGRRIWSFDLRSVGSATNSVSTAALAGDALLVGYSSQLVSLNARTGALNWTATTGGPIFASPSVSGAPGDQVAFIGDLSGDFDGFSVSGGRNVFSSDRGKPILASAAVADGIVVYAGRNGNVYCLGSS
jgi:outer membrane protein assembly factor BamB